MQSYVNWNLVFRTKVNFSLTLSTLLSLSSATLNVAMSELKREELQWSLNFHLFSAVTCTNQHTRGIESVVLFLGPKSGVRIRKNSWADTRQTTEVVMVAYYDRADSYLPSSRAIAIPFVLEVGNVLDHPVVYLWKSQPFFRTRQNCLNWKY